MHRPPLRLRSRCAWTTWWKPGRTTSSASAIRNPLPATRNCVIVTGFQALGTRGRALLDGVEELKMFGEMVPVRAEIIRDEEFSVHADASEIIGWLRALEPQPRTVYCVHGEPDSSTALAARITAELGVNAVVPELGHEVRLS